MINVSSRGRLLARLVVLSFLLIVNLPSCSQGSHGEKVYVASSQIPKSKFLLVFYIGSRRNVVEIYDKRGRSRLVAVREMLRSEHAHNISEPLNQNWKKSAAIIHVDLSQKFGESLAKLDCGDELRDRVIEKRAFRGGGHFLENKSQNGKCITSESFDKSGLRYYFEVERADVPGGILDAYDF